MNWTFVVGIAIGLVVGINLGVLLMVALQAGRRQEQSYDERVLLARIEELERTPARPATQAGPTVTRGPFGVVEDPPKGDASSSRRVTG